MVTQVMVLNSGGKITPRCGFKSDNSNGQSIFGPTIQDTKL